jgi:hypothetical protein
MRLIIVKNKKIIDILIGHDENVQYNNMTSPLLSDFCYTCTLQNSEYCEVLTLKRVSFFPKKLKQLFNMQHMLWIRLLIHK